MPKGTAARRVAQARTLPCEVTGVGIDWITCTTATKSAGEALWALGEQVLRHGAKEGDAPTRWQMKGYRGWNTPHCRVGVRSESVLLSLSEAESQQHWQSAVSIAENCSRLDLAVDSRFDPARTTVASDVYQYMAHVQRGRGKPSKRTLIQNGDGGSTVYTGARVSELYGRLYDKGREQETEPAGVWWRWEVEVKGDAAFPTANTLAAATSPADAIASRVSSFFCSRTGHTFPHHGRIAFYKRQQSDRGTARRLRWLSSGVRPTVQQLVQEVGRQRVLEALGLLTSAVRNPSYISLTGGSDGDRNGRDLSDDIEHVAGGSDGGKRVRDAREDGPLD